MVVGSNGRNDFRMSKSQELLLDIIRVCAAQLIVLSHFVHLSRYQGWLAELPLDGLRVSVFFLLSGFLIFATTWRRRGGHYGFWQFMVDRTARLWVCLVPALAFTAIVAALCMPLPDYPATMFSGPVHFIGNLLMLEDYPVFQILRRLGIESSLFVRPYAAGEPYWTLPIEFWLYVFFGFVFFYGYMQGGRPGGWAWVLFGISVPAVVYHASTGYGQCLALVWALGCAGPWAVRADRRLQQRYGLSDRAALAAIMGWMALCLMMMGLRGASRGVDFYELQMIVFLAGFLIGGIWLTGRINVDRFQVLSAGVRWWAKQTYALYLTHNAVLVSYISAVDADLGAVDGLLLVVACNVVAVPFYYLFDRHHKRVADAIHALVAHVRTSARRNASAS